MVGLDYPYSNRCHRHTASVSIRCIGLSLILLVVRFIYGLSLNISKRGVAIALLIVASSLPSVASSLLSVASSLLTYGMYFYNCILAVANYTVYTKVVV